MLVINKMGKVKVMMLIEALRSINILDTMNLWKYTKIYNGLSYIIVPKIKLTSMKVTLGTSTKGCVFPYILLLEAKYAKKILGSSRALIKDSLISLDKIKET